MSKTLTVNNISFQYPTPGDEPGWGGESTDWASEVTDVLNNVVGPDDILETSFAIANNQTSFVDITGLVFNIGTVRSSVVDYNIYRTSSTNPNGIIETGEIHLVYDSAASSWLIGIADIVGNSGVTFQMTSLGQIQYKSTDIGATTYVGTIKFSAKAKQQV